MSASQNPMRVIVDLEGGREAARRDAVDAPAAYVSVTTTVERRGDDVLIGINRQVNFNRFDPPTRQRLGAALYQYEHDPLLRAAVLFSHGPRCSRVRRRTRASSRRQRGDRAQAVTGGGIRGCKACRPIVRNDSPASTHSTPAIQKATLYSPSALRMTPAPKAAIDAPA